MKRIKFISTILPQSHSETEKRKKFFLTSLVLCFGFSLLNACLPPNVTPPPEPDTPTPAPLPSSTIVWFPPSATSTLEPGAVAFLSATPLGDMKPGIGSIILNDRFTDDTVWDVAASDQGSAAISRNRLTLAVQPGIYLSSLRRDQTFGNFYAEITVRISLCRAEDTYGLIVRSVASYFYRFVLSCNGLVSVERINSGSKLPIYEPVPSGDAPLGAPGEVRIGLWAVGAEMRLFLNDRFQFSLKDNSFPSGALGVFARANGDTPMTVTFSELVVYEVDYVFPTRTPSP